jgi:phage/plasmid-like protein (TIGR03299 family)
MSKETLTWLNTMDLIGRAAVHGKAWHFSAEHQGDEPNHYDGFIPREDVVRRLFNWSAVAEPMYRLNMTTDGVGYDEVPGRKLIVRSDTGHVMAATTNSYEIHQYEDALLNVVGDLADGELGIGSAGLLEQGGTAWVQVEMTEGITLGDDLMFPFLTAATSHSARYATQYRAGTRRVVCDNTLAGALNERGSQVVKVRHTRNSALAIADARETLGVVFAQRDAFAAEVEQLLATPFSGHDFLTAHDVLRPKPDEDAPKVSLDRWNARRDEHLTMWSSDERVAPWTGTAWGALQTFNTWEQHNRRIKGGEAVRGQKNKQRFLDGGTTAFDVKATATIRQLAGV